MESVKLGSITAKERIQQIEKEIYEYKNMIHILEEEKKSLIVVLRNEEYKSNSEISGLHIFHGPKSIDKHSSIEEKSEFLLEQFYSRRDVYAVRSKTKDNRKVYYPKCLNFGCEGCLKIGGYDKRKGRNLCEECPMREYEILSKEIIIRNNLNNTNMDGINAVGIYPVFDGEYSRFIAYDFDDDNWQRDSLIVASTVREAGFDAAIERSFSGCGAHVWIFFRENIKSKKLRRLAYSLLDKASEKSGTISFKSFDRVFPMQDSVPEGGLGNLILMPLVLSAATRKDAPSGTVFVDDDFKRISDQIHYLSTLKRHDEKEVDSYLSRDEVDDFVLQGEEEPSPRWLRRLPDVSNKDVKKDKLEVTLSSGISICKKNISNKLLYGLKKMSSFYNQEYFKKQKRNKGYSSINERSVIEGYIEDKDTITLPRGIRAEFDRYMNHSGIPVSYIDKRIYGTGLEAECKVELRQEQVPILATLINNDNGIFIGATSVGKTIIAEKLIEQRKEKTLIIVPNTNLLNQWEKSLKENMVIKNPVRKRDGKRLNKTGIGVLGGSRDSMAGLIDVVTYQSLFSQFPEMIREYGMVIVDECHHVAADTFSLPLQEIKAKYVYGLTATDKRSDKWEKYVYWLCGPVIAEYSADRLAEERGISQFFIPRFTDSTLSVECERSNNYMAKIKELSEDEERNHMIIDDVSFLISKGRRILILTHLVDHVRVLSEALKERGIPYISLLGGMSNKEKKRSASEISDNKDGKSVIISTGQYLGEGADIAYLDTLLIVTPISWEGKVAQFAGRIAREYKGKDNTLIYDYVDYCVPLFYVMYQKRIKTYISLGYVSRDPYSEEKTESKDEKSFFLLHEISSPLLSSMINAKKRIIISSPSLYPSASFSRIVTSLESAVSNGVEVVVITSKCASAKKTIKHMEAMTELRRRGIRVEERDGVFQKYVLIDSHEVWFGTINVLGESLFSNRSSKTEDKEENGMLHIFNKKALEDLWKGCFVLS